MNGRTLASLAAAVAVTLAAASVSADDHVVGGTQILLRAGAGGALTLQLRGVAVPIPAPGSADDPSTAGLAVSLFGRGSHGCGCGAVAHRHVPPHSSGKSYG